jgi:hypothetical protein
MGYLREDWLFLWAASDPQTAPPGATGVFPRPLSLGLWKLGVWSTSDSPLGLHVPMLVLCVALAGMVAHLAWRHATATKSASGGPASLAAFTAAGVVGCHPALVELRLWAAASNGLLAGVLAVAGLTLLWTTAADPVASSRPRPRMARSVFGWSLLLLAGLARADAWALMILPLTWDEGGNGSFRGRWRWETLPVILLGVGALVAMQRAGGDWGFRPEHAGHLLRRLVIPWGPPLPPGLASALGALGLVALAVASFRSRGLLRGACTATLAILAAATLVPWAPAGRYLLVPVVSMSLAVATWIETAAPGGGERRRPLAIVSLAALGGWLALGVGSCWMGNTGRELRRISAAETTLYAATKEHAGREVRTIVLLDAPAMGWRSDESDAENVVSAALRRSVEVELRKPVLAPRDERADLTLRFHPDGFWRVEPDSR